MPLEVKAIAAALSRLIYDEHDRRRVLDAAPGVLARYSWAEAARQTLEVLERSAGGPPASGA